MLMSNAAGAEAVAGLAGGMDQNMCKRSPRRMGGTVGQSRVVQTGRQRTTKCTQRSAIKACGILHNRCGIPLTEKNFHGHTAHGARTVGVQAHW